MRVGQAAGERERGGGGARATSADEPEGNGEAYPIFICNTLY